MVASSPRASFTAASAWILVGRKFRFDLKNRDIAGKEASRSCLTRGRLARPPSMERG